MQKKDLRKLFDSSNIVIEDEYQSIWHRPTCEYVGIGKKLHMDRRRCWKMSGVVKNMACLGKEDFQMHPKYVVRMMTSENVR